MPRDYTKGTDYVQLDAPYQPLTQFILDEQVAGRLAQLEPWDETRTLREAIKAMRQHRLGALKIGEYYARHSEETENVNIGKSIRGALNTTVGTPSLKNIPEFVVLSAMLLWQKTPDREKPIVHSKAELGMVGENEVYEPLDQLVKELEQKSLIKEYPKEFMFNAEGKPLEKPVIIAQTPLTLRQAFMVLEKNVGGHRKITSHMIDNKKALGIDRADEEIKLIGNGLHNFLSPFVKSKSMRMENLPILTMAYQNMATPDEALSGISRKTDEGLENFSLSREPVLRRGYFRTGATGKSPFDELLASEMVREISTMLLTLTPRQKKIIERRFFKGEALEEIALDFPDLKDTRKVGRERIRQIEAKALERLRHPARSGRLGIFVRHYKGRFYEKKNKCPSSPQV